MARDVARKALFQATQMERAVRVLAQDAVTEGARMHLNGLLDEAFPEVSGRVRGTVKGQVTKGNYGFACTWIESRMRERS